MAPNRGPNRAKEFADLEEVAPKDFDPEADVPDSENDASGDDDDKDARDVGKRDHYIKVGKSKLRKPKEVALGPQYRGSKVSRDAVESEDEDVPFSNGFDEEESEDEEDGVQEGSEDEDTEDGTDATDLSGEEDEDEEDDGKGATGKDEEQDRAELRKIMATEQKAVVASISAATKADAEKGRAVKKQRTTFDALLNTRIKLQKSLIATNTLVDPSTPSPDTSTTSALEAAETAAFNLWSSLTTFRSQLASARSGEKRERPTFTPATPLDKLWSHTQQQEESALAHRNATLQKWSVKARGPTATPTTSRLNNATPQATIVDVLREHLATPDRLLKRAHTPRSCAPLQASSKNPSDQANECIYDDADFYGLLLKELLEARSASDATAAANLDVSGFTGVRREAKTKRNVDVKASKGRKLKYGVHEKLQNFMAPEETGTWGERQARELFGSLFGQRLNLGEDGEEEDEAMEDGVAEEDVDGEAGLMMFRR